MKRVISFLIVMMAGAALACAQSALPQLLGSGYDADRSLPSMPAPSAAPARSSNSGGGSVSRDEAAMRRSESSRQPALDVASFGGGDGAEPSGARFNKSLAERLAEISLEKINIPMHNKCYAGVKEAWQKASIKEDPSVPSGSAYMFADWAEANPEKLKKMGLGKLDPLPESFNKVPAGATVVFARGVCGMGSEHGHIEIMADQQGTRYGCSDGCREVGSNKCLSYEEAKAGVKIYIPQKGGEEDSQN